MESKMITNRVSYPGYLSISVRGVYLRLPSADATARPAKKVAERIEVGALVTTEGTTNKLIEMRFFDRNRDFMQVPMLPSEFEDFRQFKRLLLDQGYKFPEDPKVAQMLHSDLVKQTPKQRQHVVHRQGWHGNHFVFAGEPVRLADRVLSFEPANPDHARNFGKGGTLPGWRDGVAKHARHSTRLTLAISLAFASALLKFSDVENGGIHLTGDSAFGKTTFMLAAASVSGRAVRNDLYSWDNTKTGLEELAAAYNDNLLCLDETQRAEDITTARARVIRDAVFKLAGGTGRIRSTLYRAKMGLQSITWRVLFLSTGEHSLNEIARIDSMDRLKGELVRAIDLPTLVHEQHKGFESLPPDYDTALKLAEHIEAECLKNYGVALREFVKCVAQDMATIRADIAAEMERFFKGAGVPEQGWEHRFAKRFALAYAAAKLAIKYEIVPWDAKMVARAIKTCYLASRATVPDADEVRSAGLMRLRERLSGGATIVELVRSGHKVQWSTEQISEAETFRRSDPEGTHYLVLPKTFIGWFNSPRQADLVITELDRLELLIKDPDMRTHQALIKGVRGRRRYYAIREAVLNLG
jgi:putative DNA primase/helicase